MRTTRTTIGLLTLGMMLAAPVSRAADDPAEKPKSEESLEKRVEKLERRSALDRIDFSGDFRFEAHSIRATIPDHFDGMRLQNLLVNTLFFFGGNGRPPSGLAELDGYIAKNYGSYLYFTQNLTFGALKEQFGSFPPALQQQLLGFLLPATYTPGTDANNSVLYTNRLRLRMRADVAKDIEFDGRLSMYKVFGDSTGVQVFAGQPTQINIDGTTAGVPNSDILRVERAYFTWKNMWKTPLYLSIGRRPSTQGAPLQFRQDEPRGGTPLGSVVDFQFDGVTLGYHLSEESTVRLCYGLGYESGFGNGETLKLPADRVKDAHFFGLNWDIVSTPKTFVQATALRAFNVTDGFNGLVVLPNNPVTGQPIGAPVVLRFTPSANVGDIDLASVVLIRRDGPVDWFVSGNVMRTHPENVTTPFGGLLSDPFETPELRNGWMLYSGARLNLNGDKTKIGLEYNHGSKYWFNFAAAEDDIIAPKTGTRGDVFEAYITHRIAKSFVAKLGYIHYSFDYSGSGFHLGAPKKLSETPVLGFPTYDKASMLSVGLTARF